MTDLVCSICEEVIPHKFLQNKVIGGSSHSYSRGQYECSVCGIKRMGLAQQPIPMTVKKSEEVER